jgi:ubiquinone/menaquinone biosynthesis C-methylase UbiE
VAGIDMTAEMLAKSRQTAHALGLAHVQFREGLAEALPVEDVWADVVISNGVINLCADKQAVFAEIFRVLRPGGPLQFADIANGRPVPAGIMSFPLVWVASAAGRAVPGRQHRSALAAHIRFWVPSLAVAPEPRRRPSRRLATPSAGMTAGLGERPAQWRSWWRV